MNEYFRTVLLVLGTCAILFALSPDGSVKKSVRLVLSLVLLSVLVLPLGTPQKFTASLPDFEKVFSPGGTSSYFDEKTEEALFSGMEEAIRTTFGIPGGIRLSGEAEKIGDTYVVRRITLTLSGAAALYDIPSVVRYLTENTGADCEVIYP